MNNRRDVQQQLEQQLREREIDAEKLWGSLQFEAGAVAPALATMIEGASRRVTWALWEMAMFEAMAVFAELEVEQAERQSSVSPWLCQSCKRRMLRVVGRDAEAEIEGRAAG